MATEVTANDPPSAIQAFYSGKTIFLTGASGFVGKLVVEKLLRTCTDLNHIYILLREKKGKLAADRFKDIFDVPAFDILKAEQPDFLSKISILHGDLALPFLGLSDESQKIIKEQVNCIFGIGATVRFDENLKKAAYVNVRSTRDLLSIAKEVKHLQSFVYMSTAYSTCVRKNIDEQFHESIMSAEKLLDLVECLDDNILESIKSMVIQDNPNTYVFSKAIAEDLIRREAENLPIAVVRPSIVISTFKEPIPGWIDNLYGPTSMLLGAALGLLRTIHGLKENICDVVPVDFVVNATLAASWDTAQNNNASGENDQLRDGIRKQKIYNYVSSPQNPLRWYEFIGMSREAGLKVPSPLIIWHANFTMRSNYYYNFLIAFLCHTIPAHIIDFFAVCLGKKPIFVEIFKKIDKVSDVLTYFTLREWTFTNNNARELWNRLNSTDKKLFNFDITSMSWRNFCETYVAGARLYLLKDPLDTIPQGRRKLIAVRIGHYILVTILCLLFYKVLSVIWHLF